MKAKRIFFIGAIFFACAAFSVSQNAQEKGDLADEKRVREEGADSVSDSDLLRNHEDLNSAPRYFSLSNHDNPFPRSRGWNCDNIYFSEEGRAALPAGFKGRGSWMPEGWDGSMGYDRLVGWGGGLSAEVGYDWDGWLFGISYSYFDYSEGKKSLGVMKSFENHILRANVSKILTHEHIKFLPTFMDLRIQLGAGVAFLQTHYYASLEAMAAVSPTDYSYRSAEIGAAYNAGVFLEINAPKYLTPYFGVDFNMVGDKGGLFFMPTLILGVRLCGSDFPHSLHGGEEI